MKFFLILNSFLSNKLDNNRATVFLNIKKGFALKPLLNGAESENRTRTLSPTRDFESRASTNSAIPAR